MPQDSWVSVILGLLGIGITVTLSLLGIIFSWLKGRIDKNEEKFERGIADLEKKILERLRSLGHEDREIRAMLDGLKTLFIEDNITRRRNRDD